MQLTNEQIRSALQGTVRIEETENGLVLRRFSEKQHAIYCERSMIHARSSAGMRLEFVTDSANLALSYWAHTASSRTFCYFDVFVDGAEYLHFGHDKLTEVASVLEVALPEGEHRVTVYLPNLFETVIRSLTLDDGASFTPYVRPLTYFAFGDSITQGYDATHPSLSYVNQIADKMNAAVTNFGIGGEVFIPDLISFENGEAPDIVTVAYGTNDWSHRERDDVIAKANEFYARVRRAFPKAKIFAITPIWRADDDRVTSVGALPDSILDIVTNAAQAQEGVTVIRGYDLIPHITDIFSDLYLHPNDIGFRCYAEALYAEMKPHLEGILK